MTESSNPTIGHNSDKVDKSASAMRLKSFVERIERIEVDLSNVSQDRKEIYSELKSAGFDPKLVRKVVRIRKMPKAERQEEEALMEVYLNALGDE